MGVKEKFIYRVKADLRAGKQSSLMTWWFAVAIVVFENKFEKLFYHVCNHSCHLQSLWDS